MGNRMVFCKWCGNDKDSMEFVSSQVKRKNSKCRSCEKALKQQHFDNNIAKGVIACAECSVNKTSEDYSYMEFRSLNPRCKKCISDRNNEYARNNPEKIRENNARNYENNKEEKKAYSRQHKKNNRANVNAAEREKKKNDLVYKFRVKVSSYIATALKKALSSKGGCSVWNAIGYTPDDLVIHLESQFALPENLDHNGNIWMTRENHGGYIFDEFYEHDSLTWKWHLDHIIPHSKLPYDSFNHPNFKKVWALSNLRPLRADTNIREGNRR